MNNKIRKIVHCLKKCFLVLSVGIILLDVLIGRIVGRNEPFYPLLTIRDIKNVLISALLIFIACFIVTKVWLRPVEWIEKCAFSVFMLFVTFVILSEFGNEDSLSLDGKTEYFYEINVPSREETFVIVISERIGIRRGHWCIYNKTDNGLIYMGSVSKELAEDKLYPIKEGAYTIEYDELNQQLIFTCYYTQSGDVFTKLLNIHY